MENESKVNVTERNRSLNNSKSPCDPSTKVKLNKSNEVLSPDKERHNLSTSARIQLESTLRESDENERTPTNTSEIEEFWDFLKEMNDLKTKFSDPVADANDFMDFLKPEGRDGVSGLKRSCHKNSPENRQLFSFRDSGSGESFQKNSSQVAGNLKRERDFSKSGDAESSPSDDAFWDFLNNKSNQPKALSSDDEFWDFLYSKSNQKKAADSEDEFWDFLKDDSPTELSDVVKSITDSIHPTPRSDATITDTPMNDTPFSDFSRFKTGKRNTSTPIKPYGVDSQQKLLDRNLSARGLDNSKKMNVQNKVNKKITNLPSNISSSEDSSSRRKDGGVERLPRTSSTSSSNFASTDENYLPLSKAHDRLGETLPCCISSVFSMQPYSSTGKVVTEDIPPSIGLNVYNPLEGQHTTAKTSEKTVFTQEKNKTLPLKKAEKKVTNVYSIRRNLVNNKQSGKIVNNVQLSNSQRILPPPNIRTVNVPSVNSSTNEAVNKQDNLPGVLVTRSLQVSSENTAPVFINTSQTNAITPSDVKSNPNPMYFLLPGNSDSFRNPNYSHYFLIVNNNPTNQPPVVNTQIQNLVGNNTVPTVSIPNQNISQSTNVSDMRLLNPQYVQSSNFGSLRVANSTNTNVTVQNQAKTISLPNSSIVNVTGVMNSSTSSLNQQSSQNIFQSYGKDAVTNINYIPVTSILLKEPLFQSKNNNPVASPALTNNTNSSFNLATSSKPIKTIPLGKNKNAILQMSVLEKMGGVPDEEALAPLGNDGTVIPPLSAPLGSKAHPICQAAVEQPFQKQEPVLPPVIKYAVLTGQQIVSNGQEKSQNSSTDSKAMSGVRIVTNISQTTQPSQDHTLSLNINIPISECEGGTLQANISLPNEIPTVKNQSISENVKIPQPNQYVQVKLAPPPNTIQGILPTPVSMVPISIVQPTFSTSQPSVSKVLVLKGQPQITPGTTQCNPVVTSRRSYTSRTGSKSKKNGPKTVRQLLDEYRKKQMVQGPRLQKPILKRILKLPVNTVYGDTLPGSTKVGPMDGDIIYNPSNIISNKRPNILVLPSASKHIKKNVIKDNTNNNLVARKETDFGNSSLNYETDCDSYFNVTGDPFYSDKRDFRPRHYDMSELQIGLFKVEDDIEYTCGRFRSKFKVLFSKCQFLYDFPVSRCNRTDLKTSHIWEKRVRVVVPFKTITSMELRDRTINISLSGPPSVYLGRVQARAGVISNTIVYDTLVEDGNQWGEDIKNTLTHKVVLRKRQANKLKTSLCEFDDSFVILMNPQELGTPGAVSSLESDMSPTSLKKDCLRNKKLRIRRLSRWDSPDDGEESNSDDSSLLENRMCSCRISCRSIRCSCVKAARSCRSSSSCLCVSCDNPLNILESLGMNIELSLSDSCLFQNIYPIPKLADFLKREMKLTCCNTIARVQDCIPGTVLCPNVDCNVHLEFSWCRGTVCYPERNPRNHCSFCGQCSFSNKRHCFTCMRCYIISPKIPYCPTCKEIPPPCAEIQNSFLPFQFANQKIGKPPPKPEIILLDSGAKPPVEQKKNTPPKDEDENSQVSEIQDMITIESPGRDDQVLLEYAATL